MTKKRKEVYAAMVYGRFLVTATKIAAPIMIITMMIATIPYMSVFCVATPLIGVDVGAVVGAVLPA